jgi:hypothetical protein
LSTTTGAARVSVRGLRVTSCRQLLGRSEHGSSRCGQYEPPERALYERFGFVAAETVSTLSLRRLMGSGSSTEIVLTLNP